MKKILMGLMALTVSAAVMAVPAKRVKRTLTLADGSKVETVMMGDEFLHYFQDEMGNRYTDAQDGTFRPLSDATLAEGNMRRAKANANRLSRAAKRKATWGAQSNHVSGTKRGIVILVNFKDKLLKHSRQEFDNYFNQVGYSNYGMNGSVHDYFYASSYGQLDLEFDVVGPYTVSNTMSYYGKNDANGEDMRPATMVSEAIRMAAADGVDYSQYDWDNDGEVDQVFVIYAGYGESQSYIDNTIWPHEYELSSAQYYGDGDGPIYLNGKTIDTYATSCELRGASGSLIDGIGTACHEFSHCMAIPDFYDSSGSSSNFGMDCWDLMDYGCYNGATGRGESPWTYTSYERMYCGWLTPVVLSEGCNITDMQPLNTKPEAYIIYNEANHNEYYLLENRQLTGFDQYGYGHGMIVIHVDFDRNTWAMNTVNNTSTRQRMTIIAADNSLKSSSMGSSYVAGDPFPGTKNKHELTNTSYPSAKLYNKNTDGSMLMNKPITDIQERNGLISFVFNGGSGDAISAPQSAQQPQGIFDLQGRPVANPGHGLYIKNGKKVVL